MMRIVFLGPPGVGKGTQAKKLQAKSGVPLIVVGDILRAAVSQGQPLGKQAQSYMQQGALVPDRIIIELVLHRIDAEDCQQRGFLLDGFPRTIEQAQALDQHQQLDCVFYFSISDEVVIKRMEGRRVCQHCDRIYHIEGAPPRVPGRCDECGGELIQRVDDIPTVIQQRLAEYRNKTAPLLDYYQKRNLLVEIPADRSIEAIFADLAAKVDQIFLTQQGQGYD